MNSPDQGGVSNKVAVARILLVIDLIFWFYIFFIGLKSVIDPPTTACGRAPASLGDAITILVCSLPLVVLSIRLWWKPTHTRGQTIVAAVAIPALTLLAIYPAFVYAFQNGFCIQI
jgi:hypothetical protein